MINTQQQCPPCLKCGADDGGAYIQWRAATIHTVPMCANCCNELVRLLEANREAVAFMTDLKARAQLAACNVGGSARH
jgi:hypothetical protein